MRKLGLMLLAATIVAPAPVLAQDTTGTDDNGRVTQRDREDDDDDFPIGLLGLLGLGGLLGLKRKDGDIHVDARRDTRR
ncbi:MAG: WGxxGxxG family protein [Sphingomicrobium sp.]